MSTSPDPQADLAQEDLPKADLPQADLPQADLPQADLPQADQPQADQQKTALREEMMNQPRFVTGHLQGLLQLDDGSVVHLEDVIAAITAITPQEPEERFTFLSQWFREGTWMHSASSQINKHPAAKLVIAMGEPAIPMALAELTSHPHHWYGILQQLTGAQPVPEDHAGQMAHVRQDWLDWGRENGYIPKPPDDGETT